MNWKTLRAQGKLDQHSTSKVELDDLRAAIARNLQDAAISSLSADNRFSIAYQAALLSAKMAIACRGYRVKGQGAHQTTFQALPLAMGAALKPTADYFDRCRRKRNDLMYDHEGSVSASDAVELFQRATNFHEKVEGWIAIHYASFAT
jgi:hypothetical protein